MSVGCCQGVGPVTHCSTFLILLVSAGMDTLVITGISRLAGTILHSRDRLKCDAASRHTSCEQAGKRTQSSCCRLLLVMYRLDSAAVWFLTSSVGCTLEAAAAGDEALKRQWVVKEAGINALPVAQL